ncbi:hypothetical protein W97_08772 [Coniosporium apollinis CBS 100218]|uniref:Uncharacterized protein n=1 Tax=Coniosporium apollinis (strain CBS 100218) TaxID=1168221 RepID=R7Z5S5_CONA1|nr:uncharacterized protein W97_08772 [Coniosporium apollinis CBS 100218]EON69512.1 hypothetical protein W97_08772 [Coniosporium apollinis CBS 100218]
MDTLSMSRLSSGNVDKQEQPLKESVHPSKVWFRKIIEIVWKRSNLPLGTKEVGEARQNRRKSIKEKNAEMLVEGINVNTDASAEGEGAEEKEVLVQRGVDERDRKSVEVTAREVRRSRRRG